MGYSAAQRVRFGHLCAAGALTGHGDVAKVLPHDELAALAGIDDNAWATLDYAAVAAMHTEAAL